MENKIQTKVIDGEGISAYERWELPNVEDHEPRKSAAPDSEQPVKEEEPVWKGDFGSGPLTAAQIEVIQRQAFDEAHAEGRTAGYEEGRRKADQEVAVEVRRLQKIMNFLDSPVRAVDDEMEEAIVNLAMTVARQLVRREVRGDPGQVVAVVREALAYLPIASRGVALHLHPEDASVVREALSMADQETSWRITEDPTITRGGCRVNTEISSIDATMETRLAAMVAKVLGGERESDGDTAD